MSYQSEPLDERTGPLIQKLIDRCAKCTLSVTIEWSELENNWWIEGRGLGERGFEVRKAGGLNTAIGYALERLADHPGAIP